MTYLIKIHPDGSPRLVECPDKSKYIPDYDSGEKYNRALQQALDDESKHIQFKNQEYVLDLLPNRRFENRDGDTFLLPIGVSVSFEESCSHDSCPVDGKCEHCKEPIKLAILTPSHTDKPECPSCGSTMKAWESSERMMCGDVFHKMPIPEETVSKDEKQDKRRWPAIRAEEKLKDWGSDKVTIIDGKSEFHFGWRKCLEWIQKEYDITPKKKRFEE